MGINIGDTQINAVSNIADSATGWANAVQTAFNRLLSANNPFGTAATRNTGNSGGQIPLLNVKGRFDSARLPPASGVDAGVVLKSEVSGSSQAGHVPSLDASGKIRNAHLNISSASETEYGTVRLKSRDTNENNNKAITNGSLETDAASAGFSKFDRQYHRATHDTAGSIFAMTGDLLPSVNETGSGADIFIVPAGFSDRLMALNWAARETANVIINRVEIFSLAMTPVSANGSQYMRLNLDGTQRAIRIWRVQRTDSPQGTDYYLRMRSNDSGDPSVIVSAWLLDGTNAQ